MPGAYRYSASLDKTYRDEETGLIKSSVDLNNQNGDHTRTCSMDSLDSISSSGGSFASSSTNSSAGNHSRQVSADSTSSSTIFTSPASYVNRIPPSNPGISPYNPHQFINAGSCGLHKTASEQIKVVQEVVKTYRTPVKEDEEEWQQNLCSWKSKRRVRSETTFQRVDEMKQLETINGTSEMPKRKIKTFSEMRENKARRPSYNLSLYADISQESSTIFSEDKEINEEKSSESDVTDTKDDNSSKDKDDGYSSKDECNKMETDDQSDSAANDDQMSMLTESSGVSEPQILPAYSSSAVETFQETARDADCSSTATSTSNSSEEDFPSTAFHESDYEPIEEIQTSAYLDEGENSDNALLQSDSELPKDIKSRNEITTLILSLKPNSEIKDFGFTMKGGKDGSSNVLVESVAPKSAAEKAGVMVSDVIKTINGEETYNRSHSALVFAVKQAGYTGQLHLGVIRTSAPEELVIESDYQPSPKPKSAKVFQDRRAIFLQKEEENKNSEQVTPSRDSVTRRKSMFDGLASQDSPKRSVNVDVRLSLRDRVASFESIEGSSFKKYSSQGSVENVNRTPPAVKPKFVSVPKVSNIEPTREVLDKEYVLSKFDLIETNVDPKSDSDEHLSDSDVKQELSEEVIIKEKVVRNNHNAFENSEFLQLSDSVVESPKELDQHDNSENPVEDVSDALEEALALIDEPISNNVDKKNDSINEEKSNDPVDSDLNVIYDSNPVQKFMPTNSKLDDLLSNNEFLLDDNFDRPRSFAEPPKEKPPPPPIEIDTSPQNIPPMKRLNSTKRIKKEILRRRSDFLGLGDHADDTVDIDEIVPKPPRQIDDLFRFELEMEKSLPSPTFSSDYAESSIESPCESNYEQSDINEKLNLDESIELEMQEEEEKRIRELEEQRIQMQEARRRAEEERLLHERVEQMRKQQEMLLIEKERVRREQNEVLKTRSSSESSTSSASNVKSNLPTNMLPVYSRSKNRPRAPPPPPPKPAMKEVNQPPSTQERGRSEVIRLSKRPTSGDFSGVNLYSGSKVGQPIQKQPLSRHSLQSLSAVPKANLSNSDSNWMKRETTAAKRRSDAPKRDTYSHWLIQEAEMRRISEQSERKRVDKQTVHNRNDFNTPLANSKSESNIARSGNDNFIPESVINTLASRVNKMNDPHQVSDTSPSSNHDWSPQYQIARSKSTEVNNIYGSSPEHVGPTSNYGHYNSDKVHNSPPMHAYYQNLSSPVHCAVNNSNYVDIDMAGDQIVRSQHSYELSKSTPSKGKDNMLSVSGRKKCSNCLEELGRGAAMIIESLKLFYHIKCFRCSVCQVQLGNGSCGADVRVRNHKLHCQNCYSNDEGMNHLFCNANNQHGLLT
ncbi:LIM and calponin y domains-containing protein 1 [Nymphon striatum]|nr:LIM and calponin y domains-containing protein 1 [Nymphon striatum]